MNKESSTVDHVAANTIEHENDTNSFSDEDQGDINSAAFFTTLSSLFLSAKVQTRVHDKMAQPAPKIIDLSTLWSDGNGDRPGTGYTQIPRGAERHTKYLEKVTNAFNRDAQLVAVHGQYMSNI